MANQGSSIVNFIIMANQGSSIVNFIIIMSLLTLIILVMKKRSDHVHSISPV